VRAAALFFLLVIGGAVGMYFVQLGGAPDPPAPRAPLPETAAFIGSESCKVCHEDKHGEWLETAHAYSLREPTREHVKGSFDGQPIDSTYFRATPYERDGEFWMKIEGKRGRASGDYPVSHIVGRSFEQAYLYTGPRGGWRVLPLSWSIERGEWDKTHEVLGEITSGRELFENYDTLQHVFNRGCGQCHATNYDMAHDPKRDAFSSTYLEGAVACESCHGPGSVHAAWHKAERSVETGYETPARLLHPKKDLNAVEVAESCGRCHYMHEWRYAIADDPRVGHHDIAMSWNFDRPGFYADGRLAGLNYHGTTQSQSACFQKGEMSCFSCHRMHGGKKWAMRFEENDDRQCLQCHAAIGNEPAEQTKHSHHKDVRCVDCHMPKLLSGVLHFLRDHSIGSPEPELTERFGAEVAPNACTACHEKEGAKWERKWRETWWGKTPERLVEDVSLVVALREDSKSVDSARLREAAGRAESRRFFRMTAIRALVARGETEALVPLLHDSDVEVLQVVCQALGDQPSAAAVPGLLALLDHKARTVRVEAAFAAVRAGARGDVFAPALLDARGMLVRQEARPIFLERIAILAEATGRQERMVEWVQRLLDLKRGGAVMADLLQRRARYFTEEGMHEDALRLYENSAALGGPPHPYLSHIDSADSLVAVGRAPEAVANWQFVVENADKTSLSYWIASARLEVGTKGAGNEAQDALRAATKKAASDLAKAEILRRARWTLKATE